MFVRDECKTDSGAYVDSYSNGCLNSARLDKYILYHPNGITSNSLEILVNRKLFGNSRLSV